MFDGQKLVVDDEDDEDESYTEMSHNKEKIQLELLRMSSVLLQFEICLSRFLLTNFKLNMPMELQQQLLENDSKIAKIMLCKN